MATVSPIVETFLRPDRDTRVSPGLLSVLIGTTESLTTFRNWKTLAMHAGILVARPLMVLGVTQEIPMYDGNIAVWTSVKYRNRTKVCLHHKS